VIGIAKMTVQLPDDFINKLSELGNNTDDVMKKVLKAGGEVVKSAVASSLAASLGKGPYSRPTGQLASALGVAPPKLNSAGDFDTRIGFAENRSDGEVNAKLAAVLEYGKYNQPGRPFMSRAKSAAKGPCVAAMKAAFDEAVKLE
jgi:hypothetical protein